MKTFISLLLVGLSLTANAQIKAGQAPYLTKSLANEAIKNVEVKTSGGSIAVTGGSNADARVEVYVNSNRERSGQTLTKDEIQKRLAEDYDLSVTVSGGKLIARAKPREQGMDWKRGLNISFRVFVPEKVATNLTTSGGNIQLTNISGEQHFTTSGGDLQIDRVSGRTKGSTSGGSIHLKNSKDFMDLTTSGGDINATDCTGNLQLATSGGSLHLTNLNGVINASTSGGDVDGNNITGELSAHTSGGDIELKDMACSLSTSTSGGNLEVAIKKPGKYIKLNNSGGDISLHLPKNISADLDLQADEVNVGTLNAFNGVIQKDEVRGKLNGGGVRITADAGSGNLSLSVR
ncbi:DUF4097 family beta strand repeat protein [Adhaeribacter swui]|uniref:DUF4097 family beta strand repeat protein n=1 Tax=Adhaeribacter swui TaxID=2086471 RepID=A0A7G7G641_9BACT|nr:DUF4097 family beta strand repeat-containing protein [Adhaeribacter swui]QNF32625.1 DUF4097 family beta strand repeat protein [Adhaeribacter swui]